LFVVVEAGIETGCWNPESEFKEWFESSPLPFIQPPPLGLAKGAKVTQSVQKDTPIKSDDVQLKEPSTILDLWRLQTRV
jgi:hypothetical protein